MAELALVASIVQIADVGCRLSLRLYTFGETVASADRSILGISKDVSLTCTVLQELGTVIKGDSARICSNNATQTAEKVVQECSNVFEEMDGLLLRKVPKLVDGNTDKQGRAGRILERLRWPTIKGKVELLNLNLDRLKSTLTLMLNVIIYAQQMTERYLRCSSNQGLGRTDFCEARHRPLSLPSKGN